MKWKDSDTYEVQAGDVWQVGDDHTLVCSDIVLQTSFFRRRVLDTEPDLVYSDPPWSDGQVKQYRTLSRLHRVGYGWKPITLAILGLAKLVGPPLWIVHDRFTADEVRELLPWAEYGRWWLDSFGSESVRAYLHYSGTAPPQGDYGHEHDSVLPERIIRQNYPDDHKGLIVDPCNGLGSVNRCAARCGWRSLTNEVSPQRCSASIRKLERLVGVKPELVERT